MQKLSSTLQVRNEETKRRKQNKIKLKECKKTKQIIKAILGHDSVNPTVQRHASKAIPSHNCKAVNTANPRMQSSQKGLDRGDLGKFESV